MSDHPKPHHPEAAHPEPAHPEAGHPPATEAVKEVVKTVAAVAAGAAAAHHDDKKDAHADHGEHPAAKKDEQPAPPPVTKIIPPLGLPAMPPAIPSKKEKSLTGIMKKHPTRSAVIGGITLAVAVGVTAALMRKPKVEYPEGFVPYKMDTSASAPTPEPIHASPSVHVTGTLQKDGSLWRVVLGNGGKIKLDEKPEGYPATAQAQVIEEPNSDVKKVILTFSVQTPRGTVVYATKEFIFFGGGFDRSAYKE